MPEITFECVALPGNQPCLLAAQGDSLHVWIDYPSMDRLGISQEGRMEMLTALFAGLEPGRRTACLDELSVWRERHAVADRVETATG